MEYLVGMELRQVTILIILIILVLSGCFNFNTNNIETKLIGTWELDSTSTPNGEYISREYSSKTLIFNNNTDYSFEWWNYDVGATFTGKYFVLDNPKRGLKTIAFVPDIQMSGKDTIRIEYMNFDIVSISSTRLQVVDETDFIERDSLPYVEFTKNYIYRKKK